MEERTKLKFNMFIIGAIDFGPEQEFAGVMREVHDKHSIVIHVHVADPVLVHKLLQLGAPANRRTMAVSLAVHGIREQLPAVLHEY